MSVYLCDINIELLRIKKSWSISNKMFLCHYRPELHLLSVVYDVEKVFIRPRLILD